MVSFSPSASKLKDIKYFGWAIYDDLYPLSTNDTVVCPEFIDDIALKQALLINDADGALITSSITLNVVTVTQAAVSNVHCTLFVYGQREA